MSEGPNFAASGQVLVIDDDAGLRDTVCEILAVHGISSASVGTSREAVAWVETHVPDVVVLDQRLPDASGLDTAAAIKERTPLVPIVLLTGYASEASAIAAIGLVDDYLTKPVQPGELVKVLRARIDQHRLREANRALLAQLTETNASLEQAVEERTAELRIARDEAVAASGVMSTFLTSVSHELRTPLNAILGFSDLMGREPSDGTTSQVPTEWIDFIHRSGQRLLALINDLLDLSKSEAGEMVLHAEPVNAQALVEDAVSTLQPLFGSRDLEVVVDVEPMVLLADPLRSRQILDNLLSNALKFTPDGGRVEVHGRIDGFFGRLDVRDSGVGIAEADLATVFEPFRQVGSPDGYSAGTGLGLALVRSLVERQGGKVSLASEVGIGSTFTIHVPLHDGFELRGSSTREGIGS